MDVRVVQEFLWLVPELKNARYKHVLTAYLERHAYPLETTKRGFIAAAEEEDEGVAAHLTGSL